VNKQRAATRAFTEQTAALNQKLGELSQAVKQTEEIAKQNLALKHLICESTWTRSTRTAPPEDK
jgi:hypothetical protein